jgi:ferredoxin--NADP+ reductase
MYAVQHLLEQRDVAVEIDLYERLPTPWGLVRAGVAPDHPEKKLIIDRQFAFALRNPRVRFLGNVEVGRDVRPAELSEWYDATIYATGAASDTRMGIPGEELPGCYAAREFVGFYNGHPDYSDLQIDLQSQTAVVVGNGNVALDVARILTMPVKELETTDIADRALAALHESKIREVVLLGRRGHLQAAFANAELEELEHLPGVDIMFEGGDMPNDDDVMLEDADWATQRKLETLRRLVRRPSTDCRKRIVFRFLSSPVELMGDGKVEQLLISRNRLERDASGKLYAQTTGEQSVLQAALVLRAIGYRGDPFPGLPFDTRNGVIQNHDGRVTDGDVVRPGAYVTGWIKRGCRGIIGSNKKCAAGTVAALLNDWAAGHLHAPEVDRSAILSILRDRQPNIVHLADWNVIDRAERAAGRPQARPRRKFTETKELLACAFANRRDS